MATNNPFGLARRLIISSSKFQANMESGELKEELIHRSVPIIWFGKMTTSNWVTIGTNPSSQEFLDGKEKLLPPSKSRFFIREPGQSLENYWNDNNAINSTIDSYQSYFERNPLTGWFGRKMGGRLEALINGMGASFYTSEGYKQVVHADFFPIATRNQMSKIRNNGALLDSDFASTSLNDTLKMIQPRLIAVLGSDNSERFSNFVSDFDLSGEKIVEEYPAAKYKIGYGKKNKSIVIELNLRPSENMVGLGRGNDRKGLSYGKYQKKEVLIKIGKDIIDEAKRLYPNHTF